jgi:GNAT superfamily N-acetyltransferase
MSISIRRARREDALSLALLGERTFRETFASENRTNDMELFVRQTYGENIQARELADPKRHIFVARDAAAAEPVGYLHLFEGVAEASVRGTATIELLRLYVDGRWHGRGGASALLEVGLDHARDLGFRTLWLGVWERNLKAQAFYKKWGFKEVGAHVFNVGTDPQRDLVMERALF